MIMSEADIAFALELFDPLGGADRPQDVWRDVPLSRRNGLCVDERG